MSGIWLLAASVALARRYAVLVSATTPPEGLAPLRYADDDVLSVRDALLDVAGFEAGDVLILHDPSPEQVLWAVRAAPADLELLLVYYTGHAKQDAIFPGGRELSLNRLKDALGEVDTAFRLGVLDACGGGAWTGAKGVVEVPAFDVEPSTTGTAFIAASSGAEKAYEASPLQGSIFTHHWIVGLRGAADANHDGAVSLSESYAFARSHTVRDSAVYGSEPQHPSFDLRLQGRSDVVLAELSDEKALTHLSWGEGALDLFAVDPGRWMARLQASPATLDLPRGWYVAKLKREPPWVAQFEVRRGQTTRIGPEDFVEALDGDTASKGLATQPRGLRAYATVVESKRSFALLEVSVQNRGLRDETFEPFHLQIVGVDRANQVVEPRRYDAGPVPRRLSRKRRRKRTTRAVLAGAGKAITGVIWLLSPGAGPIGRGGRREARGWRRVVKALPRTTLAPGEALEASVYLHFAEPPAAIELWLTATDPPQTVRLPWCTTAEPRRRDPVPVCASPTPSAPAADPAER